MLGTAAYLAPEQAHGEPAGPPADLYALGVVTYQFLAGRLPYEAQSLTELAFKQQREVPPALNEVNPEVSAPLAVAVQHAMALDPRDRYPSAEAMRAALVDGVRGIEPATPARARRSRRRPPPPSTRAPAPPPPRARSRRRRGPRRARAAAGPAGHAGAAARDAGPGARAARPPGAAGSRQDAPEAPAAPAQGRPPHLRDAAAARPLRRGRGRRDRRDVQRPRCGATATSSTTT